MWRIQGGGILFSDLKEAIKTMARLQEEHTECHGGKKMTNEGQATRQNKVQYKKLCFYNSTRFS
jgi:hypothetical protein